jgi:hypothetical protein
MLTCKVRVFWRICTARQTSVIRIAMAAPNSPMLPSSWLVTIRPAAWPASLLGDAPSA